ncbi:ankyrin [Corynespora cassiicola Philippines]|uniref:Ankyrin n=1 Tax=Corynespora cassiicola Philippines TaxID=1448308 RepID=A0A2T2N2E1_CORCC|nr:ankyrin [Corynespora cassiicola Philippines]
MENLKDFPSIYDSTRGLGDVLVGEDTARLLIEASSSGNETALQSLLSQPEWIKEMLQEPHRIYRESRPSQGPNDIRQVTATPMSNLEWTLTEAASNGHVAVVSTLFAFAKDQGVDPSQILAKPTVYRIIGGGDAAVVKEIALADPDMIHRDVAHGVLPLYEAVRRRRTEVAAVLLELGADPLNSATKRIGSYNSALMSLAAMAEGPRMTELLLERGTPIAQTGALHTAAHRGQLDTMRLLMQHGADVNEVLSNWRSWTPLHFAASKGQVDAMKLLEDSGARSDLKDKDGKTPAQLLEEANTA